jgi:formylglycine-generating enzyme required for sulfatase activity
MRGPQSRIFLLALFCLIIVAPAHADKRVALVIGNSNYKSAASLDNPKRDAALMAETLASVGFALVGGGPQIDLDAGRLREKLKEFGKKVQGADVGLFYYAGHGVQVRGKNYLIPTDATDFDLDMIDADAVLHQMQGGGTSLNIIILDACRNDPFSDLVLAGRAGDTVRYRDWNINKGLAEMTVPPGTLIAFSAQAGSVAQDGTERDSPFTAALAEAIHQPGLDLEAVFKKVQAEVYDKTHKTQLPYVVVIFPPPFFFIPPAGGNNEGARASSVPQGGSPPIPAGPSEAERTWGYVKDTASPDVLEDFIRTFPATIYAKLAREKLEQLKAKAQVAVVAPPTVPAAPAGPCGVSASTVSLSSRSAAPLSAAEECSLKPRDTFKECVNCPEMVVVPAGSFTMGSPASEKGRAEDEGPQHTVTLRGPFAVGKFALTMDEWDACVAESGCNGYKPLDEGWGRGRRPVINVSWDDAKTYVAWLAKKTGQPYRMVTEAEYEYAARAGTTTTYYWGDDIGKNNANCGVCGSQWDNKQTAPVGSFGANGFGLYDMAGNVWDWTEDCYHISYNGAPANGSAWTSGDCGLHVLRGGAWSGSPRILRSANRGKGTPTSRANGVGFRIARTLSTVSVGSLPSEERKNIQVAVAAPPVPTSPSLVPAPVPSPPKITEPQIAVVAPPGVPGAALAADMTGPEIKALLSGKTTYLETTAASSSSQVGLGVIYWAADGTALFATPSGSIMHGTWVIKENTNCTDWRERPGSGCVRYEKTGDTVTAIDAASGKPRFKIIRTAGGNAENLKP